MLPCSAQERPGGRWLKVLRDSAVALLLVLAGLSCALAFPPSAHGLTGWFTYRLTDNDVPDYAQDIADGYAYWNHFDGHDFELYERFLPEARVTQLTDNDVDDDTATMDMGLLSWRAVQVVADDDDIVQIWVRRVWSGEQRAVSSGDCFHNPSDNRAGHVVWYGQDGGEDFEIFHFDIATGLTTQVTNNDVNDVFPTCDAGKIVYETTVGLPGDVVGSVLMVYSPRTGTAQRLSRATKTAEGNAIISANLVAFRRWDGHDWEVWLHNLDTGVQTRISSNDDDDAVIGFDCQYLLWRESREVAGGGIEHRLHLWDARIPAELWVSPDWQRYLQAWLTSSTVAWSAAESRYADTEIYVYRHYLGSLTRLTTNDYDDYNVSTDGNRVLWTGEVGAAPRSHNTARAEVFLAVPFSFPEYPFFRDVLPRHPYFDAIMGLHAAGVLSGYNVNESWEFRPEAPAWRAQFAKMICETLGLAVPLDMPCPFMDLGPDDPEDPYPHQYVAAAAGAGITKGTGGSNFSPYVNISRAQLVTMIVRAAAAYAPGVLVQPPARFTGTLGAFDPVHGPTMATAEYSGLLKTVVEFGPAWDPWAPATRGEMAALLWELRGLLMQEK